MYGALGSCSKLVVATVPITHSTTHEVDNCHFKRCSAHALVLANYWNSSYPVPELLLSQPQESIMSYHSGSMIFFRRCLCSAMTSSAPQISFDSITSCTAIPHAEEAGRHRSASHSTNRHISIGLRSGEHLGHGRHFLTTHAQLWSASTISTFSLIDH